MGLAPVAAASPAPPLEGAAVLGVVVELRHPLLEQVAHLAALQVGHGQLVLSVDKSLQGDNKDTANPCMIMCIQYITGGVVPLKRGPYCTTWSE